MDEVALIREKIDIVSLLQEYIPLKKAGKNFKANCPFHNEKTPSFIVSSERQTWHCFGCGKHGDCYSFLMEYERMEFPEALRFLAKRTGIELTQRSSQSAELLSQKEKIYQMNVLAREYYHYVLTKHAVGQSAREYLKERGITAQIIETFQLGFSPNAGTALSQYLIEKKHYSKQDVIDAGLAFDKNNRAADFFRGRLMFPLIDHRDNVVGFSGRVLDKTIKISKYINTRETVAYHKGEHFYGINLTKDAIRKENQAIIVEGEFDVIACFQNGIGNVVGVKGTALTENQVNLLGRYTEKITFCFDGDHAGQEAIKHSLTVVEKKGLTPTVIEIPSGKDPDESLKTEPGLFKKAVKNDIGIYDYLLEKTLASVDKTSALGKKQITDILLPMFSEIKNEIIKEHYLRKLSQELDTSYESMSRQLRQIFKPKPIVKAEVKEQPMKKTKEENWEEFLLSVILQSDNPQELIKSIDFLADLLPQTTAVEKIFQYLFQQAKEPIFHSQTFAQQLPSELVPVYDTSMLLPLPEFTNAERQKSELEKTAHNLEEALLKKGIIRLVEEIEIKKQAGDEAVVEVLTEKYNQYNSRLKAKKNDGRV
jgi:DNA primase